MKIALCHSFYSTSVVQKVIEIKRLLEKMGNTVIGTPYLESSEEEIEKLMAKEDYSTVIKPRVIREHFNNIKKSDAILVINLDKGDIRNYIGGNTFAEIMFAFYNEKKIFLFNSIPEELNIFSDEIKAVSPTVINGNLDLIS